MLSSSLASGLLNNDLAIDWAVALLGRVHWACWRSVSTIARTNSTV